MLRPTPIHPFMWAPCRELGHMGLYTARPQARRPSLSITASKICLPQGNRVCLTGRTNCHFSVGIPVKVPEGPSPVSIKNLFHWQESTRILASAAQKARGYVSLSSPGFLWSLMLTHLLPGRSQENNTKVGLGEIMESF